MTRLNIHDEYHPGGAHLSAQRANGVLAETLPRASHIASQSVLVSGRQSFVRLWLEAGMLVSNITFVSGTTAAVTPTAQWFSLYDDALAKLAVTADDTTTAWAGGPTRKTLAVASPYTITASGFYRLGIMVAAATVPTLLGAASSSVVIGLAPFILGADTTNTGLTTPSTAPNPAAALSAGGSIPYAYVS